LAPLDALLRGWETTVADFRQPWMFHDAEIT